MVQNTHLGAFLAHFCIKSIGLRHKASDELSGYAVTYTNSTADYPTDLIWLLGNIENAKGGSGNDKIFGNNLNNYISGGPGNDRIEGWEGNDTLIGGSGSDTFYFSYGWGVDTIIDFNTEEDVIVILDNRCCIK